MSLPQGPHRRLNLLTGEWLLVSPQRALRPWQGQQEPPQALDLPEYDPTCYLCPRNTRANGQQNPDYQDVYVFVNDFSALEGAGEPPQGHSEAEQSGAEESPNDAFKALHSPPGSFSSASAPLQDDKQGQHSPQIPPRLITDNSLTDNYITPRLITDNSLTDNYTTSRLITDNSSLITQKESGHCEVICFSPRHDLTLAQMDVEGVLRVVDLWCDRYAELSARPEINHIQIFENKGAAMGCSNPHPHGQIWAQAHVPELPACEGLRQAAHHAETGRVLLLDYLDTELQSRERLVLENEHFAAVVPFWAAWPFETLVLPKRHVPDLQTLRPEERLALADAVRRITCRYDNLFQCSFPYSAGIHQAPCDGQAHPGWQLHMHFFPPLLRSASVRKFMVGYELLAEPQRDISAESAAARLRELSDRHYTLDL
jgi:UDPglucose--hexose-1-phosphate uridylyltransferase